MDPYRVMLPASLSGIQKTKWECGGLNLPGGSPPLLPRDKAVVINLLLQELSDRLALKLDLCPNLDREVVQQVPGGRRFVIVGASHADRTGDTLIRRGGATVKKVIMLAWRPIRDKIPPLVAWMETAMADEPEDSLVTFQLLDSSMYLARTEEGGLAPAKHGTDGIYHMEGESTLAPQRIPVRHLPDDQIIHQAHFGGRRCKTYHPHLSSTKVPAQGVLRQLLSHPQPVLP